MLDADERGGRHSKYPLLYLDGVSIRYGSHDDSKLAVEDVSFEVWAGEKMILLGTTGCGKSTLLKAIAGFIRPEGGTISFAGREDLRPGPDRAVVFQDPNQLFPWRTILDNVAYPLRVTGYGREESEETAAWYLEMFGLGHAADLFPHQLSGDTGRGPL
jgi:NitT/TauT family transport system ATP-binding protein